MLPDIMNDQLTKPPPISTRMGPLELLEFSKPMKSSTILAMKINLLLYPDIHKV
jgi:hypothetical protein